MPWGETLLNVAAAAAAAECPYVSGWDDVGETEVTTREAVTWGAAGAVGPGYCMATNQPVLAVSAACTIDFIMLWAAASGGDPPGLGYYQLDPPVVFAGAGNYTLTLMAFGVE